MDTKVSVRRYTRFSERVLYDTRKGDGAIENGVLQDPYSTKVDRVYVSKYFPFLDPKCSGFFFTDIPIFLILFTDILILLFTSNI